jgi:hypothetical protein
MPRTPDHARLWHTSADHGWYTSGDHARYRSGDHGWPISGDYDRYTHSDHDRYSVARSMTTVLGEEISSWDADVQVNPTLKALEIIVTGSKNQTVRWVATLKAAEVRW